MWRHQAYLKENTSMIGNVYYLKENISTLNLNCKGPTYNKETNCASMPDLPLIS
jgi:hypothetical protein